MLCSCAKLLAKLTVSYAKVYSFRAGANSLPNPTRDGGAENAGLENAGVAKMQGWKTREWKTRHQTAGVENAGLENAAPDCRGGKRGTGKCRSLKSMESEDFKNVFLTVLTERIVWKQTQTLHKGGLSRDDFLGVLKVDLSNY